MGIYAPHLMSKYNLQISFSTLGEENTQILSDLRDKLAALQGGALRAVYEEFKLVPTTQPTQMDQLGNVDIMRINSKHDRFSFFILQTETDSAPFFTLWISICKMLEPNVRCDVVGSGPGIQRFCQPLFVPEELCFNPRDLPLLSKEGGVTV